MIFKIKSEKNEFIERVYNKSMKEFSKFYDINWVNNKPIIILLDNRKDIDSIKGMKTENWVVGWDDKNKIFLLNPKNYETESDHKYSKKEYEALIKHELNHAFFGMKTRRSNYKPVWLDEGLAIFISGQNKFKKTPEKFEKVLEFYDKGGQEVYKESGFLIDLLIKRFGKGKLISLIIGLDKIKNRKSFERLFKKIYGFDLNYKNLNSLWKDKQE